MILSISRLLRQLSDNETEAVCNMKKKVKVELAKIFFLICLIDVSSFLFAGNSLDGGAHRLSYPIVDTNQTACVVSPDTLSTCPLKGEESFGQDAQYKGLTASYSKNEDGTVTDNNTQLIWAQSIDTNGDGKITIKDKMTYENALKYARQLRLAGHDDWRIPSIKELYSLMMFDGQDPSGIRGKGEYSLIPFIDNSYFGYNSGDIKAGERLIDAQYLSSTKYVSLTMRGDSSVFGVNFIDGRIKGYGLTMPDGAEKYFYILPVRGNYFYGTNKLVDNSDNTISDKATGLTWQRGDSERGMDWPSALAYCEDLTLAGNIDWRLPNVKELQSIVDYSRSPDTTSSASIDSLFEASRIINEAQEIDYANYWSSTTHLNVKNGKNAAYVAFGRSLGKMNNKWQDVHGAGSQRSDPKTGDASQFTNGHGPQGDAIRINNYVRCVSGGNTKFIQQPIKVDRDPVVFSLTGQERSIANDGQSNMRPSRQGSNARNEDVFTQLDENGDGKISRLEAKGPLADDFTKLDKNKDGYLIQTEIPDPSSRKN